jgi:hypothetical protein
MALLVVFVKRKPFQAVVITINYYCALPSVDVQIFTTNKVRWLVFTLTNFGTLHEDVFKAVKN